MSVFQKYAPLRWLKWLAKRTLLRPGTMVQIVRGPLRGCRFIVTEDTGWAQIYGGWEPASVQAYQVLLRPGHVAYDLGANTGIHSLLFAKLVGDPSKVIAFEPLPSNIAAMKSFFALNGAEAIRILDIAVSDSAGSSTFHVGVAAKQGSLVGIGRESGQDISVRTDTLDNLIDSSLSPPDFIKIDIEGAEGAALAGFSRHVGSARPTFAIDLHTPEQDVQVGAFLASHGYRVWRLRDGTAVRMTGQRAFAEPVARLDIGWPAPDGIWGTIVAIHPSRTEAIRALEQAR